MKFLARGFAALLLCACVFAATPAYAISTTVTLSAAGVSSNVQLDPTKSPNVALLVNVPNGVTASCEVDVAGSANGPWNPHDTLVGLTASANGNLAFLVSFIRLNCATLSGGSATLTVIQPDTAYPQK